MYDFPLTQKSIQPSYLLTNATLFYSISFKIKSHRANNRILCTFLKVGSRCSSPNIRLVTLVTLVTLVYLADERPKHFTKHFF